MKWFQDDPWLQSEGSFDGKGIWHGYLAVGEGKPNTESENRATEGPTVNLHLVSDVNKGFRGI